MSTVPFLSPANERSPDAVSRALNSFVKHANNVVTQAEAEAGTGTTTKQWTPERVKQAVSPSLT